MEISHASTRLRPLVLHNIIDDERMTDRRTRLGDVEVVPVREFLAELPV